MIFSLFHNRRKQILEQPFTDSWLHCIEQNALFYGYLDDREKAVLRDIVQVLMHEKNWEGCKGLEMTDEIRVTISAQAALLLLGIEHDYYANVESILVYPYDYVAQERIASPGRVITEAPTGRLGEAWSSGMPVILSWPAVLAGGRNMADGRNVVLHEFAHKLDFRDGVGDGVPRLRTKQDYERWAEVMSREFQELVAASHNGHATLLNHYGATNPAEFFAVTTECFFERPRELQHGHPDLYEVFLGYYAQDPAERLNIGM